MCVSVLQHVAWPCTTLPFTQLQSVQYASELQNLLSIPQRPASSAQRLFPVVEEQHDSLPVLCVKKHQVCHPHPSPSPRFFYNVHRLQGRKAVSNASFYLTLVISSFTLNAFEKSQIKVSLPELSSSNMSVNPVSLVLFKVNVSNIHFETAKVETVTVVTFKCQSRSSIALN